MRRSGAFTLAVVLTLGAVSCGRGQELSSSVTAANGSLDGFVLPSVPENWADLPFKLTASQSVSYNSNISSFPIGVEGVKSAGGVPGRAGRQDGALDQRHVGPPKFRQMVKNGSPDDPSADHNRAVACFHPRLPIIEALPCYPNCLAPV